MKLSRTTSPEDRLFARIGEPTANGCREWQGKRDKDGYGLLQIAKRQVRAHVFRFELEYGFRPPMTCHTCDNPPCCEIEHLFPGDAKVNSADMVWKGRAGAKYGTAASAAKLSAQDVVAIRNAPRAYGSIAKLAKQYGVYRSVIDRLLAGKTYTDLAASAGPA